MPVRTTRSKKGQQISSQRSPRRVLRTKRALKTRRGGTSPKRSRQSGRKRIPKTSSPRLVNLGYREDPNPDESWKTCLKTIQYKKNTFTIEEWDILDTFVKNIGNIRTHKRVLQKELIDAKKADGEKEEKERKASIEREKEGQLCEQRKQTYQRGALTDQTKTFTSFLKKLHSKLKTERDYKKSEDDKHKYFE